MTRKPPKAPFMRRIYNPRNGHITRTIPPKHHCVIFRLVLSTR